MLTFSFSSAGFAPGNSVLHRVSPYTKGLVFLAVIASLLAVGTPGALGVLWAGCCLSVAVSSPGRGQLLGLLRLLAVLALVSVVLNAIFTPGSRLPGPGGAPLWPTAEGLEQGWEAALRLMAMALMGFAFVTTTHPRDLGEAVDRTLGRIPALSGAGLAVDVASRFAPGFIADARRVAAIRAVRLKTNELSVVGKIRESGMSVLPLMVCAVRRAERLADAMAARCYEGGRGRLRAGRKGFGRADFAVLAATAAVCCVALLLRGGR